MCQEFDCNDLAVAQSSFCNQHRCRFCTAGIWQKGCCRTHSDKMCQQFDCNDLAVAQGNFCNQHRCRFCTAGIWQKGCCRTHSDKMCQEFDCNDLAVAQSSFCNQHRCRFCTAGIWQKGCCRTHSDKMCQEFDCNDLAEGGIFCRTHNSCSGYNPDGRFLTMYHGTSRTAAAQIELHGFCPSSDGMLGAGVYLSRNLNKARNYGPVILECKVLVGKVARIDRQGHPLQKTWHDAGFDTAWVPPGCGMVASGLEEDCVYEPARIQVLGRVMA
ncbi:unnamed protein product [Effrenium voratum]|uniref:PARP catalytic domain-containing protein n=1 Tax=Effrenium voratum TaxID=2562239 RepID=A0AA36J213_9DINO|nr:unnamed protein product [Effrenium voratum]